MPKSGPRGGERFRASWQPVINLLWTELDREHWKEVAITGPVQGSKSFGALVVPTLRDVVELKFEPIVGVPEADMFADKWDKDFKPVFDASPDLQWLIPQSGSGAKGGRVRDRVTLGNNVDIKVMSRGGQATNKAGYTSPRLRITEAAGFSGASKSETDEEADAYRQLVGRLGAFSLKDPRRLVTIEGTGTVARDLPWRLRGLDEDEVLISSQSRLVAPCPHCEGWISPEREHLIGWQNASSMLEALNEAKFLCPLCGNGIDDDQRKAALQDVRIVHHGQEIAPDGTIVGPLPPTLRLWFRWSAWHNCLLNAGDTAVKEWEASQIEEGTIDRENAERDLAQKSWATPYTSSLADNEPLNPQVIRKRRDEWPRGVCPPDTKFVTIGVDMGKWTGWWVAIAWRECGLLQVVAYGAFDVCRGKQDEISTRTLLAIRENRETVVLPGFRIDGKPDAIVSAAVGYDINWMSDDIGKAVREGGSGWKKRFFGMRGRGKSVPNNNGAYHHPKFATSQVPMLGTQWYAEWNYERKIVEITFNSDYWTLWMQERLRTKKGCKGALTLFRADTKNEHAKISNHFCADHLEKEWDPKRGGVVEKWLVNGDNHWGDACKMACVLGDKLGYKLREIDGPQVEEEEPPADDKTAEDAATNSWYARMRS